MKLRRLNILKYTMFLFWFFWSDIQAIVKQRHKFFFFFPYIDPSDNLRICSWVGGTVTAAGCCCPTYPTMEAARMAPRILGDWGGTWGDIGGTWGHLGHLGGTRGSPGFHLYVTLGAELLKVANVKPHVWTKFSRIFAKCVLLNAKQENQALCNDFSTIWKKSFWF